MPHLSIAANRPASAKRQAVEQSSGEQKKSLQSVGRTGNAGHITHVVKLRGPTPSASLLDILSQNGLSELRGMAREYDVVTTGLSKQQLAEAIAGAASPTRGGAEDRGRA